MFIEQLIYALLCSRLQFLRTTNGNISASAELASQYWNTDHDTGKNECMMQYQVA